MDDDEKREFMKTLSENYIKNIDSANSFPKKKEIPVNVKFDSEKNQTHYFDKGSRVSKNQVKVSVDKPKPQKSNLAK